MSHRQEQEAAARKRRLVQLAAVAAVAAIAVVVLIVVSSSGGEEDTAADGAAVAGVSESRAMLEGIPQDGTTLGDPKAEKVLTEFADLQCPFCRDYALQVLPQVIRDYVRPGKLRLDLRLLRFIGPDSDRGGRAAYAAAEQDRMWDFVDLWYRNQGPEGSGYADDAFIADLAQAARLRRGSALEAIETSAHEEQLTQAEGMASAAGIDSTPSFLLGDEPGQGRRLSVPELTYDAFRQALDAQLG